MPAALGVPLRAARRREALRVLLLAAPWLVAVAVLVLRHQGTAIAVVALATALLATGLVLVLRLRPLDAAWAVRRLDERRDLEDSSDLLLADAARLGPLQRLQRERVEARLRERPADLRRPLPRRALTASLLGAAAVVAAALAWPTQLPTTAPAPRAGITAAGEATAVRLLSASVETTPPAYTGLPASQSPELSLRAPEGSRLRWSLRFEGEPEAVALALHDGTTLPLTREGEVWTGELTLAQSRLYRVQVQAARPGEPQPLHRLEATPDLPPEIRAIEPDRNLSLRSEGQRSWPLRFEARDDHGLGAARLVLTLAQGTGEQVTVSERTLPLRGEGDDKARSYVHALDLAAIGLAEGDDLIVRLEVADNRAPAPQWSRSASFILRWPAPLATETTGMEGLVQRALPAYFRSQRQIILDIEALVPQRPALAPDDFTTRSDVIGVDQRILRLRYGQFLGEEDEPGPAAPPTGDHDDGHHEGDGHDHGGEPPAQATAPMGSGVNVLEDFGHTHDDAEAATLLDPQTRALLKQALDAMWQSEGELRQGQPERALPHAYRALEFVKLAQQATRIYLARTGLELPPVDETRRLTGKREGIASRRDGLVPAEDPSATVRTLWQALGEPGAEIDLAPFEQWLRGREQATDLELAQALEAVRSDPACAACREQLRTRLWPLLPPARPRPEAREAADAEGEAWLRALDETESQP